MRHKHETWIETAIRRCALVMVAWVNPVITSRAIFVVGTALILFTLLSPSLLVAVPVSGYLSLLAEARAFASGAIPLTALTSPIAALLVSVSESFGFPPGYSMLIAKALFAFSYLIVFSFVASMRLPLLVAVMTGLAITAWHVSPMHVFAPVGDGVLVLLALMLLWQPIHDDDRRARIEGIIAGGMLSMLFMTGPVYVVVGLLLLVFSPVLMGHSGAVRYMIALMIATLVICLLIIFDPAYPTMHYQEMVSGWNRVVTGMGTGSHMIKSGLFHSRLLYQAAITMVALACLLMVVKSTHASRRVMLAAFVTLSMSLIMYGVLKPQAGFLLMVATVMTCFAASAPIYRALYNSESPVSVSKTLLIPLCGVMFMVNSAGGNIQSAYTQYARSTVVGGDIHADFEHKLHMIIAPDHQDWATVKVLEAFIHTQQAGHRWQADDIAILGATDLACILDQRPCYRDGLAAAKQAKIILVPQIPLDPLTTHLIEHADGFLYSEFKRIERADIWDVWERR